MERLIEIFKGKIMKKLWPDYQTVIESLMEWKGIEINLG